MSAGTLTRALVLAAVVVIAAAALCLGHVGEPGHLCTSLAATPVALLLTFLLGQSGAFPPAPVPAYRHLLRDLPAPPPKV